MVPENLISGFFFLESTVHIKTPRLRGYKTIFSQRFSLMKGDDYLTWKEVQKAALWWSSYQIDNHKNNWHRNMTIKNLLRDWIINSLPKSCWDKMPHAGFFTTSVSHYLQYQYPLLPYKDTLNFPKNEPFMTPINFLVGCQFNPLVYLVWGGGRYNDGKPQHSGGQWSS